MGIITKIILLYLLNIVQFKVYCLSPKNEESNQFYIKNTLNDGVHEIMLKINGIFGKETAAGPREGSDSGIVVRQLSNGRQVVTLIYNGIPPPLEEYEGAKTSPTEDLPLLAPEKDSLLLRQCKVDKQQEEVDRFIKDFEASAKSSGNVAEGISSSGHIKESELVFIESNLENLPHEILHLTRFKHFKHQCFDLNRRVRRMAKESRRSKNNHSSLKRTRRYLRQLLILPGTKWCGNKRLATSYSDISGNIGSDVCCRDHDHCPLSIPKLSRKYGLYNHFFNTISHCACDNRFKACLKHTGTGASDVVGNVFFNLVKAKCFVFERKRVCRKGSFWRCYKYGYERQAVIKEPTPWKW